MTPPKLFGLKVLQVMNFYDFYLNKFYSQHSHIKDASYHTQISELIADGFATTHLIYSHLTKYGCTSQLVIPNNFAAQTQWAKENNVPINPNYWSKDILRAQIEDYKPDILYLMDPITYQSDFILSLNFRPRLVIGWCSGPIPSGTSWTGYDIILSNIPGIRDLAQKLGAPSAEFYTPSIPIDYYSHIFDSDPSSLKPSSDIVFSGQVGIGRSKRARYLNLVADFVYNQGTDQNSKLSASYYLSGDLLELNQNSISLNKGACFGDAYFKSLRSGKLTLDFIRDTIALTDPSTGNKLDLADGEGANARLFEATGSGAFVLCEDYKNLGLYFERDKEIAVFKDEKDLIDKIKYYLSYPIIMEEIAYNGRARCMKEYSMEVNLERLVDTLLEHLALPNTTLMIAANPKSIQNRISLALELLNSNKSLHALESIAEIITTGIVFPNAHYVRGMCFLKLEKVREAAQDFETELKHFPDRDDIKEILKSIKAGVPEGFL